jgi:hypothetical protein
LHAIKWALEHDANPTVRVQGCEAISNLNLPLAPKTTPEEQEQLKLASSIEALSSSRRNFGSLLSTGGFGKEGSSLLGTSHLEKEVPFLGRTSVAIIPLEAMFESELFQNLSILLHGLVLHDPHPSVRGSSEQFLRKLNAYRIELNLASY